MLLNVATKTKPIIACMQVREGKEDEDWERKEGKRKNK